jgi:WD40 repeat protein
VLALSPEGKQQILKREDGSLLLWDGQAGKPLKGEPVVWSQALFSRNGMWVATASDRAVQLWETVTAQPVWPVVKLAAAPRQLIFTAGGRGLLLLDEANEVHHWALDGAKLGTWTLPPGSRQGLRQVSADGRFVVSVASGRAVEVRELTSGRQLSATKPGLSPVTAVAFRGDGELLLTAFSDGDVGLWRTATGEPVQLSLHHAHPVQFAVFGPAPLQLLATAQDEGTVRVWDAETGLPVTPPLHHDGPVAELLFSKDGDALLTRTPRGTCTRWSLASDQRPADELVRLAQTLAGQKLHRASGGLVPVEPRKLKDLWPQLRRDFPREFSAVD